MNKNIKVLAIISLILFGLSIVFFSSYAIFGLVLSTDNSSITTGQIKMSYTETNEISIKKRFIPEQRKYSSGLWG